MTIAVTFDFHDTLATCDRWFEVEVFTLVPEVLRWYDVRDGSDHATRHQQDALRLYRELRAEVIRCGEEIDAVACAGLVIEQLGVELDLGNLHQSVDAVMLATLDDTQPVPGAIDAVRSLAAHGIRVGIVSSAIHHAFLEWTLERFDIADSVSALVTSASCGFYKSRREIYEAAIQQLGVRPECCVHIGDSYQFDVLTAREAGLRTIWFQRGGTAFVRREPDLTVESLVGVAPLALGLLGVSR